MVHIISAGGIIVNQESKIALVQNRRGLWGFPKGHIEEGEDELTAAKREIKEETGITELTLIKELGLIKHMKPIRGNPNQLDETKSILMFLFTSNQINIRPQDSEISDTKWIPIEKVAEMLKYKVDREFFEENLVDIKETLNNLNN